MSISSLEIAPLNVKPEVNLNLSTQVTRVLHVLNRIIERSYIAGLLKVFIQNDGDLLRDILDPNTHFFVTQACEKYRYGIPQSKKSSSESSESVTPQFSLSSASKSDSGNLRDFDDDFYLEITSDSSADKPMKLHDKTKERNDSTLSKVIYMLEEIPEIQNLAKSLEKQITPQMKFFIRCVTELRDYLTPLLSENAAQYKKREKYLRETFEKNEKIKEEIDKFQEEMIVTKTDANVCLIGRNILIKRHQNKIEKIQQNCQDIVEKKVNESEKAMVNDWKNSIVQQQSLKVDYEQAAERFANLLKDHLAAEKTMRVKRTKLENQVLGWIQKFDQDIREKQTEEEEIQGLLDKETAAVEDIQRKLEQQEGEYDEVMQEKAEFEEEMLERRMNQFIINRSARRIQRTYRLYKARKLAKKLGKKGKKGGKGKEKDKTKMKKK